MKRVSFLDMSAQFVAQRAEIARRMQAVCERGDFVLGEAVEEFERAFSATIFPLDSPPLDAHKSKEVSSPLESSPARNHCVAVGNGTDALELALSALELPPRSEILLPSNTYFACVEAVLRAGLRAVLADCQADGSFLPKDSMLSADTSAILCVHLYGVLQDIEEIARFARRHNLRLIEDCAQAHGLKARSHRQGELRAGSIGDIACFSFYPGKNLGCYGDGGAVLSRDLCLVQKVRELANHGQRYRQGFWEKNSHHLLGRNSRLDSLQAAVLSAKLPALPAHNAHRAKVASGYASELARFPWLRLPSPTRPSVWHLYVLECCEGAENRRDELRAFLGERGIECGVHYPHALSDLPLLRTHSGLRLLPTPTASKRAAQILSLPMGEHIDAGQIAYIAQAMGEFGARL